MQNWLLLGGVVGLVACHREPSLFPTIEVRGTIEGPGAFTITIPSGYALDARTQSASLRRWTRSREDPVIELDSTPTEEGAIMGQLIDRLPLSDVEGRKSAFHQPTGDNTQVRRFGGGDEQLNCFVNYPGREDKNGARVQAGLAICNSLVFTPHSLTNDPDVLHPTNGTRIRLDFPSRASAELEVKLPPRFIERERSNYTARYFSHGMSLGYLPEIVLAGRSSASTCDALSADARGPSKDDVTICEEEMAVDVLVSARAGATEVAECWVHLPKRDTSTKAEPAEQPLISASVMERREMDATAICKSLKVHDYQKIGNPAK